MPSLKSGKRIYAIGDIHGYLDALENMQAAIADDLKNSDIDPKEKGQDVFIIYLGDYIDRGPESAGVLDNLIAQQKIKDGITRIFICGNHDLCLQDFAQGRIGPDTLNWFKWGGLNTLKSYGVNVDDVEYEALRPAEIERLQIELSKSMPKKHKAFIGNAPFVHVEDDYLFAHAGIDPQKPVSEQTQEDLTYIREPFLSWETPCEKYVIHGHTIIEEPEILHHRIGVDVGVYKHGRLGCVVLEEDTNRFIYAPTAHTGFYDPKP
jgi:serine/threonine protein phosphatase 1